jgi:hypothetical protein
MSNPEPLLIMGSKRSGSTFLVNVLNQHPQVFVTHESDVVWILYQIYRDVPDRFHSHPLDEGKGMSATLDECDEILRSIPSGTSDKEVIVRTFYRMLEHINEHGRGKRDQPRRWDYPQNKKDLAWIGDKKPVQYSDPEIQSFLNDLFPEARYIHLIRDPRAVVASMTEAAQTWGSQSVPEYWKKTSQQVLDSWVTQEEWVLQVKSRLPNRIHTIRLEDLAQEPDRVVSETFGFLDLDSSSEIEELVANWVREDPNERHQSFDLSISVRAHQIMRSYGYEEDYSSHE